MDEKIKKYRDSMVAKLKEYGVTDENAIKRFADELDESNDQGQGQKAGAENPGPKAPDNPNQNGGDPGKNPETAAQAGGQQGAESAAQGQVPAPQQPADQQAGQAPANPAGQTPQPNPTQSKDQDQQIKDLNDTIKGMDGRLKADEETLAKVLPLLERMGIKVEGASPKFGAAPAPEAREEDEGDEEKKAYEEAQKRAGKRD